MENVHQSRIIVRWGDMDAYGHVNNTLFFRYFECARFDFFEQVCMPVLDQAPVIVLAEIACQFKAELCYPAEITVSTKVSRFGNSSFDIQAEIHQDDRLCASSTATMVWVDPQSHRPAKVPPLVREAIERYQAGA